MSRIRFTGGVRMFRDAAEAIVDFDPVGDELARTDRIHTGYTQRASGDFVLNPGDTFALPILLEDETAVRGIEIRASGDIMLSINGLAAFQVSRDVAAADVVEDLVALLRVRVTACTVNNPQAPGPTATVITGRWAQWGSPVV